MNKQKSTLVGPFSKQTAQGFDELEHRFSDLLVNFSLISEDKKFDQDNLFKEMKSSKNIELRKTRSKSQLEDIELFHSRQEDAPVKHALLTSDEEESYVIVNSGIKKNVNSSSSLRSPLKVYPPASKLLSRNAQRSINSNSATFAISSINISSPDDSLSIKEDSIITKTKVTPDLCRSLNTSLFNQSPLGFQITPVSSNKGNHRVLKTSTPLNTWSQNMIFKTPFSDTETQLSAQKKHSIDKAVASARQEFQEMTRSMKKKTMKAKEKDGNQTIFFETRDTSVNSTVRNSLFSSPTTADKTVNLKTTMTGMKSNNDALTGVKELDMKNKHNAVSETPSNIFILSPTKEQIGWSDEDDDGRSATPPLSSILLHGVVAYVEVRWGKDYMSEGTKAELESLGAVVEKNFTRKVTHCFFHGGKMSTYRKAIEWKVPLVSTLWIEACKEKMDVIPLKGFSPHGLEKYKEDLRLYKLKTKGMRRAITDSKIKKKPWKQDELNKKCKEAVANKSLPSASIFKEANNVIDTLQSVTIDLRKGTKQFENVLTSPVLQKNKCNEENKDSNSVEPDQETYTSIRRRNCYKKLIFGNSSDDKKKAENNPTARPRLLPSRKCKKILLSSKDTEKSKEISSGKNDKKEKPMKGDVNSINSKQQLAYRKRNKQELSLEKPTQRKKLKLLTPSQVMENYEQDSGESTSPASLMCPYKVTPNKKPISGLAVKNRKVGALVNVKVSSNDSLTSESRRVFSSICLKGQEEDSSENQSDHCMHQSQS